MTRIILRAASLPRRAMVVALALAIALAAALAVSLVQPADAARSTYYDVTGLESGWTNTIARDINETGLITGQGQNPSGQSRAFLWEGDQIKDLGVPAEGNLSRARSINGSGQVVGEWRTLVDGQQRFKAFLYEDGQMKDLNALIPAGSGWNLLGAQAINKDGQIVGSGTINSQTHAFLYENGIVTDLGVLLGDPFSEALGVNDS
jgi:probable HAF family extracellular repeat protein